jgi:hypothetical protein
MPKNKDDMKSGSQDSMSNKSDREFESQGHDSGSGKSGKQAGSFGKGTGSQMNNEEDDMKTSGGRKGNFSDKNRDSESQWSPGSSHSSDR